jgi:hypothetical protein
VAVVAVALAVGVPILSGRYAADAATEPVFPRPGGGPRVIQTYTSLDGTSTYLLDTARGQYRKVAYARVSVSPDGRTVAVEDVDLGIGLADRDALLRAGRTAVRWIDLPLGTWLWAPNGRALLSTTLDKDVRVFTAHRYDLATGRFRHTPINLDCTTCTAGWAADSYRYTVQLNGSDPDVDGPIVYMNPDGTQGPQVGTTGHIWDADAYSPSRQYAIADPSRGDALPEADWALPRILDLRSGQVLSAIQTDWPAVGWYDDGRVVRIAPATEGAPTALDVVDVRTGTVTKRVPAPGLPPAAIIQIGSSAGLRGEAAQLGF